jgi:hypothetical protein
MTGLLDTNVALYLLGGRLAAPLSTGSYGISVITEMELLAWPSLTTEEERRDLCPTEDTKETKTVLSLELNGLFAAFARRAGAFLTRRSFSEVGGIGGFPSV